MSLWTPCRGIACAKAHDCDFVPNCNHIVCILLYYLHVLPQILARFPPLCSPTFAIIFQSPTLRGVFQEPSVHVLVWDTKRKGWWWPGHVGLKHDGSVKDLWTCQTVIGNVRLWTHGLLGIDIHWREVLFHKGKGREYESRDEDMGRICGPIRLLPIVSLTNLQQHSHGCQILPQKDIYTKNQACAKLWCTSSVVF